MKLSERCVRTHEDGSPYGRLDAQQRDFDTPDDTWARSQLRISSWRIANFYLERQRPT